MASLLASIFRGGGGREVIPAELVAAIEAARITLRGQPDPETGDIRNLVEVANVGRWHWAGVDEAAERIARRAEVSEKVARRAANLLAAVLVRESRTDRRPKGRRNGWVFGWMDDEYRLDRL